MPRMVDKVTGELVEELDYSPEGIARGQQMEAENENIVMEKTQYYSTGGPVSFSNENRKRVKTRGTGAAIRGLDFYEI